MKIIYDIHRLFIILQAGFFEVFLFIFPTLGLLN